MSPRDHAEQRTAALRRVRRMTGIATGGAALAAAVLGGLVASEIPGAASSKAVASGHATTSTSVAASTSPTVVSGGTS